MKMFESKQVATAKKAGTQEKNRHVKLLDPECHDSRVLTYKFIGKDEQPLLNTDPLSLDPKSACSLMDSIFTDAKVANLKYKSNVN